MTEKKSPSIWWILLKVLGGLLVLALIAAGLGLWWLSQLSDVPRR